MLPRFLPAVACALLLAACGGGNGDGTAAPSAASVAPPPAAASAIAPAGASTAPAALVDSASTDKYKVTIRYPALPAEQAPLATALRAFGDDAKRDFLATFEHPDTLPRTSSYPWQMTIDCTVVARTPDFVSVLAKGDSYTGGAHGNPILASFTYDVHGGRVIALGDLFADAQGGIDVLAETARANLLKRVDDGTDTALASNPEWVATGTAPTADNYRVFSVLPGADGTAAGLTLWFPAYQVAAYVDGVQHVEVPATAFAAQLKPGYRAAFGAAPKP